MGGIGIKSEKKILSLGAQDQLEFIAPKGPSLSILS